MANNCPGKAEAQQCEENRGERTGVSDHIRLLQENHLAAVQRRKEIGREDKDKTKEEERHVTILVN